MSVAGHTAHTPRSVLRHWGTNIRTRRQEMRMTQVDLATQVGVDQSAISYWEQGHRAPTIDNQLAVARALQTTPASLFGFPQTAA